MILLIKVKDTDNVIGLKEDIAMRLEGVADIERIDVNADVVEVVHGEWFLLDECSNEGVYCSVCTKKVYRTEYANQKLKSNYCPNCGADMRGCNNGNK